MYFDDLSPYSYGGASPDSSMLNVGWLSIEHPFPRGNVSELFLRGLAELSSRIVNKYRGLHFCEFCPPPLIEKRSSPLRFVTPLPGTAGNGEVRVMTPNGTTFVAPALISHYVSEHGYLPPPEFVEAAECFASGKAGYVFGAGRDGA